MIYRLALLDSGRIDFCYKKGVLIYSLVLDELKNGNALKETVTTKSNRKNVHQMLHYMSKAKILHYFNCILTID